VVEATRKALEDL
jgi:hypothetical protein